MKKTVLLLSLIFGLGQVVLAGVVTSPHNLVGNANFGNPQQVCITCHVPHRSPVAAFLGTRVYASGNVTFYSGQVGNPSNSSAICMSCHDGTLAPSVGSSSDYTHSHPFSTTYTARAGYVTPVNGSVGTSGLVKLEGATKDKIECGSCHNPHEPGASANFLVLENTNSALCLTCHQK